MILYLDTSAPMKLYVLEVHGAEVPSWLRSAEVAATSDVAYAEFRGLCNAKIKVIDVSCADASRRNIT